jgi:membrane protein required for colicin V production
MNSVDIAIIVVILLFGALGIYWGLIRQLLALAGLLAGVIFASRYGDAAADALTSFIANDAVAELLGFTLVLVGISALASLLASLLQRFAGLLLFRWLDELAGGLLGLFQGLIACAVVALLAVAFPLPTWSAAIADSQIAASLVRACSFMLPLLPTSFHLAAQMTFGVP